MNMDSPRGRFVAETIIALLLALPMPASAQTNQKDPETAPSNGDSGESKTLVATVFGEPLYLDQLTPADADKQRQGLPPREFAAWLRGSQAARLYDQVWAAVSIKYGEREKLEITEKEAAEIAKSVGQRSTLEEKPPAGTTLTPEAMKGGSVAFARASHLDWKLCKSLYEKYGGRVGMGSLGAWTALDGQHALIKEYHKSGEIKFHHAELEEAFWQYSQRKHFSDTYPEGERLKWFLTNPPYSWDLSQPVPPQSNSPAKSHPQKTR